MKGTKMEIKLNPYPIPVKQELIDILIAEIAKTEITGENGVCMVFKDKSYSPEKGGFHPVEISISSKGEILYITDFGYRGIPPMAELFKELDFDISTKVFQMNDNCYPIEQGRSLFRVWQTNFCAYYKIGVFDEVRVTDDIGTEEPLSEAQTQAETETQ